MAFICREFKWLGYPVFKWDLKTRLFGIQSLLDCLNTTLVRYSDPHCITVFLETYKKCSSYITFCAVKYSAKKTIFCKVRKFISAINTWNKTGPIIFMCSSPLGPFRNIEGVNNLAHFIYQDFNSTTNCFYHYY